MAPSGECLQSKGRYGSRGWQVKLCNPFAIGPYLSALEVHDEALHKSTFFTLHYLPVTQPFTLQVTGLLSHRFKVQASGWCYMRSTLLQILLIFSSPEGYWLQISIPCAHSVYMVWYCTGQHCSSIYACMYRLFAAV